MFKLRRIALITSVAAAMAVPASAQAIEPNPSPGPQGGKVSIAPLPSPMPRPESASTVGPQAGKLGKLPPGAMGIIVVCLPRPVL